MKLYSYFLLILISIFFIECNFENRKEHRDFSFEFKRFLFEENDPKINYSINETVNDFYLKQNNKIKYCFQRYVIESNFRNIHFPLSLIGCNCGNQVCDLMYIKRYIIDYREDKLYFSSSRIDNLFQLSVVVYNIFRHYKENTTYLFFDLHIEDSMQMGKIINVVNALYFGYMYYVYDRILLNDSFYNMDDAEKMKIIKNNRFRLRLTPMTKIDYKYCEAC